MSLSHLFFTKSIKVSKLILLLALMACQHLVVKDRKNTPSLSPESKTVGNTPSLSGVGTSGSSGGAISLPDFVTSAISIGNLDVGVILGPGGPKAMAHLGVLQELDAQGVKVKSISGLGWGALVAALYARDASSHSVEWQLTKLTDQNLKLSKLFFSKGAIYDSEKLKVALKKYFLSESIEKYKVSFSCPFTSKSVRRVRLAKNGLTYRAVSSCMSVPPLISYSDLKSAPDAVDNVIRDFKNQGIDIIIYVNVLSAEDLENKQFSKEDTLYWKKLVRDEEFLITEGVNVVINIVTTSYPLHTLENTKALVRMGRSKSSQKVKNLFQATEQEVAK